MARGRSANDDTIVRTLTVGATIRTVSTLCHEYCLPSTVMLPMFV